MPLNIQNPQANGLQEMTHTNILLNMAMTQSTRWEDGSWFDLKDCNQIICFIRPYNHFMPKCYTSGQIAKYALICNVLYGASLTKNGERCHP